MTTPPTASVYPTAVDTSSSLLGAKQNRFIAHLSALFDINDIEATVDEDLSILDLPTYAVFRGSEVVYIESISGLGNNVIALPMANRAMLSGVPQIHGVGEELIFGVFAAELNLLRDAIMKTQKYQGFVGLDASKSATPEAGQRYLATDTQKVYYCFVADTWVDCTYGVHANHTGLSDDDHTQYHNDARAETWHGTQSGVHVTSGSSHAHLVVGEGDPVATFAAGTYLNRPTGPVNGQVYFATDKDGGTLYIGYGSAWQQVSGVPAGAVALFDGDCPTGWTEFTALTGKWPKAAATAGSTGGAKAHTHTNAIVPSHYHTVAAGSTDAWAATTHSHGQSCTLSSGGSTTYTRASAGGAGTTSGGAAHTHTSSVPAHNTELAGSSGNTASGDYFPASREVIFCQKD